MLRNVRDIIVTVGLLCCVVLLTTIAARAQISDTRGPSVAITTSLSTKPLSFTENQGQWDEAVRFRADAGRATMWFTADGAYYQFTRSITADDNDTDSFDHGNMVEYESDSYETMMIKASFMGANPSPAMRGETEMEYKCNYFVGNDPNEWHTDVPNYSAVVYEEVYDGIDLKYYGNGKQMEYDFIVSPGADPSQILVQYDGAKSVNVNELGQLVIETDWGQVVEHRPLVHQMIDDKRELVECEYTLISNNAFSFYMPNGYDVELALVIDPVLSYSTYLGGEYTDEGFGIVLDAADTAYVVGYTESMNFPIEGALDSVFDGEKDAFVAKLLPDGSDFLWCTYLGGDSNDVARSIDLGPDGNVTFVGHTMSPDFPVSPDAIDTTYNHAGELRFWDAFIAELNPEGDSLVYSTYFGGDRSDVSMEVVVDPTGLIYVAGATSSRDFPCENAYCDTLSGNDDVWIGKFSKSAGVAYATYLGGSQIDRGNDLDVDDLGCAYVSGYTLSDDYPTENAYQMDPDGAGGYNAFVTKLAATGDALVFSTYLGGEGNDYGWTVDVQDDGTVYVAGHTGSADFPLVNALYNTHGGSSDVFVSRLTSDGSDLLFSSFFGGDQDDWAYALTMDPDGNVLVSGRTYSGDFPTKHALDSVLDGASDMFLFKAAPEFDSVIYSTFLGGAGQEETYAIVTDGDGDVYMAGNTTSPDFPTTLNAPHSTYSGTDDTWDAAIVKIEHCPDADWDWIPDTIDNCPNHFNPGQENVDGDSAGDVCDACSDSSDYGNTCCCGYYTGGITGNTNCSSDGKLTLSDITRLIDRVYISKDPLCCEAAGNTNGSADCAITLSDITVLIDAVYISKTLPAPCMPECEQ